MTILKSYDKTVFPSDLCGTLFIIALISAAIIFFVSLQIILEGIDSVYPIFYVIVVSIIITFIYVAICLWNIKTTVEHRQDVIFNEMTMQEIQEQYEVISVEWPVFTIKEK